MITFMVNPCGRSSNFYGHHAQYLLQKDLSGNCHVPPIVFMQCLPQSRTEYYGYENGDIW